MKQYNLSMLNNATFSLSMVYKDAAGAAVDLTGSIVKMQIREYADSAAVAWSGASNAGGIAVNPLAGSITITVPQASIAAMPFKYGVYDMLLVWPSGVSEVLLAGAVTIEDGVTE